MRNETNAPVPEARTTVRGKELKEILIAAMDECIADKESTATQKLVAITAAVDTFYRIS